MKLDGLNLSKIVDGRLLFPPQLLERAISSTIQESYARRDNTEPAAPRFA
jgi:hypothetical protein